MTKNRKKPLSKLTSPIKIPFETRCALDDIRQLKAIVKLMDAEYKWATSYNVHGHCDRDAIEKEIKRLTQNIFDSMGIQDLDGCNAVYTDD